MTDTPQDERRERDEPREGGETSGGGKRRDEERREGEGRGEERRDGEGEESREDEGHGDGQAGRGAGGGRKGRHVVNWLEGVVSGLSLLLLLGTIGYLAWEGAQPDRPPSFTPVVQEVRSTPAGYDVLFDVRNGGDESVQNLAIEVEVRSGDAVLARAETSLDWLPAGSTRTAAVILSEDPREHELDFSFVGYELP